MNLPLSMYRLQLNYETNFEKIAKIACYLQQLGISTLYLSPITQAQPKSLHGYDVIDFNQINPELGGDYGFRSLLQTLDEYHLNVILDIVPNHMSATQHNKYWQNVVDLHLQSPYANLFDIDWHTSEDKLSYRRFFDINELVCLRQEDFSVFQYTHELLRKLLIERTILGVRIDHIDGLRFPKKYLADFKLQFKKPIYIIAEKILSADERLPSDWEIHGTTGYDFLNQMNQIFINPKGLQALIKMWQEETGIKKNLLELRIHNNCLVLNLLFQNELKRLFFLLKKIRQISHLSITDDQLYDLQKEICAYMPVYRTYFQNQVISDHDKQVINYLISQLTTKHHSTFLSQLFFDELPKDSDRLRQRWLNDWQVLTGPMMAKGYEDTTCYQYNAFLALNEVGSGPEFFNMSGNADAFHAYNQFKEKHLPHSLNTTSTHDTKRSEDARARLNVLSELANVPQLLKSWLEMNAAFKQDVDGNLCPNQNEQLMLYQTLLSSWPLDASEENEFKKRLQTYLIKVLREAKIHSTWIQPNKAYEKAFQRFSFLIFKNKLFLDSFLKLQETVSYYGMLNSLAQIILKMTSPGIPDIYQGNESWRFDLVDPDNRRMIDYETLEKNLSALNANNAANMRELFLNWKDGKIKLYIHKQLLELRKKFQDLFLNGKYIPLKVKGKYANHIFSYARSYKDKYCIVIIARWWSQLFDYNNHENFLNIDWQDTYIVTSFENPNIFYSVFQKEDFKPSYQKLYVKELFSTLPFNVLINSI